MPFDPAIELYPFVLQSEDVIKRPHSAFVSMFRSLSFV